MSIIIQFTKRQDGDFRYKTVPDTIFAQQVHSNIVSVVSERDVGRTIIGADGLVYKKKVERRIFLAVRVADCVPVIAYDTQAHIIGVAHAGWRGTYKNIAGNLLRMMCRSGAHKAHIKISMGPHIGACCYNVVESRARLFRKKYGILGTNLDLGAINKSIFIRYGIPRKNITVSRVCTSCHNDIYYSFRKDSKKTFGEQMGVIGI